ncbi:uncharacterized protein EI97DRAFT_468097 [Westerdykella ornata]|uniref:Uncharacterized protein n=1 Tax=Westerdykella ornata TaxID=318751 RepID=A0A6A6JGN0_WESOR|nr:uncharacterized protein EI97DRAFT_468097 [Westerdykella ornata]KAF2275128.1 hypothetical protein EI97DRAFT_468097 [Westerdykella ornata]
MSRTVEIGRAVLHSANGSLHLWLTAAITVWSQQQSTNPQQLDQYRFLELLLSGDYWVCRGYDMHIILDISVLLEPLNRDHVPQLMGVLREASVWHQLGLNVTISESEVQGQIRISIAHHRNVDENTTPARHRLGVNVPSADIKPPEMVPVISLNSVRLSLDILQPRPASKAKKRKMSRDANQKLGTLIDAGSDNSNNAQAALLDSSVTMVSNMQQQHFEEEILLESSVSPSNNQSNPWDNPVSISPHQVKKRCYAVSYESKSTNSGGQPVEVADISAMVDAAMRISVCRNPSRVSGGVKIVTSTFSATLSEVCPALFTPHYLQALSQRAHFLPTLSRSMVRVTCSPRNSVSLQEKMTTLLEEHSARWNAASHDSIPFPEDVVRSRLWKHLQSSLSERPTKSLLPFVTAAPKVHDRLGIVESSRITDREVSSTAPEEDVFSEPCAPLSSVSVSKIQAVDEDDDLLLADAGDIMMLWEGFDGGDVAIDGVQ